MAQATTTRRDRKRLATRDAIVDAALGLFEEKGFAATTVDEITERADVAQRTFFRHFETKEAVLFPDVEESGTIFRELLARRPAGEPILTRILAALIEGTGRADDTQLALRRAAILEQNEPERAHGTWGTLAAGHAILEQAVADDLGLPVADEQVQIVTSTALLLISHATADWYATGATADLATILNEKVAALHKLLSESTPIRN